MKTYKLNKVPAALTGVIDLDYTRNGLRAQKSGFLRSIDSKNPQFEQALIQYLYAGEKKETGRGKRHWSCKVCPAYFPLVNKVRGCPGKYAS
ncbi:MAG: hypothetical protein LBD18_04335 [Treponema sp.]|jgi:hypothetical protein|nr:hypothetical protein [Treponema sp.]